MQHLSMISTLICILVVFNNAATMSTSVRSNALLFIPTLSPDLAATATDQLVTITTTMDSGQIITPVFSRTTISGSAVDTLNSAFRPSFILGSNNALHNGTKSFFPSITIISTIQTQNQGSNDFNVVLSAMPVSFGSVAVGLVPTLVPWEIIDPGTSSTMTSSPITTQGAPSMEVDVSSTTEEALGLQPTSVIPHRILTSLSMTMVATYSTGTESTEPSAPKNGQPTQVQPTPSPLSLSLSTSPFPKKTSSATSSALTSSRLSSVPKQGISKIAIVSIATGGFTAVALTIIGVMFLHHRRQLQWRSSDQERLANNHEGEKFMPLGRPSIRSGNAFGVVKDYVDPWRWSRSAS